MTWVIYILLAAVAAAIIGAPFFMQRRAPAPADPPAPDKDTTPAAETETNVARPAAFDVRRVTPTQWLFGGGIVAVIIAAALLFQSSPPPASTPLAAAAPGAAPAAPGGLPDVDTMIARLAERLAAAPNDPEGWRMLGWSYFETQRYGEAVTAYAKAVALEPGNAGFQSAYGEAQVKAAGDRITPQAEAAFRAALAADAKDERARMYIALLKQQAGDSRGAVTDLFALLAEAAPDSRQAPAIRDAIRRTAQAGGIDITGRLPPEPEPAAPAGAPSAAAPTGGDNPQVMIEGMVAGLESRLAASPNDVDGWIMLMRSRKRLGQDDKASAALAKANEVFRGDAAARAKIAQAARELGVQ